jgi:hypothetical protein
MICHQKFSHKSLGDLDLKLKNVGTASISMLAYAGVLNPGYNTGFDFQARSELSMQKKNLLSTWRLLQGYQKGQSITFSVGVAGSYTTFYIFICWTYCALPASGSVFDLQHFLIKIRFV